MVIDVSEATFEVEVLERSRSVPVVVDFWAAWCGPCRVLGPILEAIAAVHEGELVLAKVDVDASPRLQAAFGIRGIPAVKAFRDAVIVGEFTGALPRPDVERFVARLLPSEAELLTAAGDEVSLRAAIEADPGLPRPRVRLARIAFARGDVDQATALLEPVDHDPEAAGLLARQRLRAQNGAGGTAFDALARLDAGDTGGALAGLVDAVRTSSGDVRALARQVAVGLFAELGDDDPLTAEYRTKLATALF